MGSDLRECKHCGGSFPPEQMYGLVRCWPCRRRYVNEWRRTTPAGRERKRRDQANRAPRRRARVIEGLGGKCRCCGETEPKFLTVQHIGGGGSAHRKGMSTGSYWQSVLRELKSGRFELLCANCHLATDHRGGCPHQEEK